MPSRIGRTIVAVVAGYAANVILVAGTEQLLSSLAAGVDVSLPLYYFVLDLVSQCLYTVIGGYVCSAVARPCRPLARYGLIGLGVTVGTVSLVVSWETEPHWYGIALLAVYPPCVWIGWKLRSRASCGPAENCSERV